MKSPQEVSWAVVPEWEAVRGLCLSISGLGCEFSFLLEVYLLWDQNGRDAAALLYTAFTSPMTVTAEPQASEFGTWFTRF